MEKMRTRFIIAVTQRLSAAAESIAKVELIEELSDNLYNRWQDLTASGTPEDEAYTLALEDLGDVDELLAYLDSLGPEAELPRQDSSVRDFTSELLHGMEGIVRETVSQTKDAVDQAAVIVRNVADKLKEKYPNGFRGKVYVHFDHDEESTDASAEQPAQPENKNSEKSDAGWSFTAGYNRDRGGFFCETGRGHPAASRRVSGTSLPSQEITSIDIQLINGDVTIHLDDDPKSDVLVGGEIDHLEVRMSTDGLLSIRQGDTASSSFFFLRGLAAADVELTLPKRFWDSIQISSVNGDISIDDGLEAGKLSVKTSSGDTEFHQAACTDLLLKSASGDFQCSGTAGNVRAETASGDIELSGTFGSVRTNTASGDVEISGGIQELSGASASGDLELRTETVPQTLDLSSKSGDCGVTMPDGEGFTLQFSTVSGDLETDFPLVGPVGARSGEAMYLDGGGRTFRITSVSGDISLHQF